MTYRSAGELKEASSYPLDIIASLNACVSYWFTLHPRVIKAQVFMAYNKLPD